MFAGGKARYDAKGRHLILTPTARHPATVAAPPLAHAVSRLPPPAHCRCSAGVTHARRDPGNGDHERLFHPRIGLLLLP